MLTRHQVADLERDFRKGYGPHQAAKRRRFTYNTVRRYYDDFVLACVPRGTRQRYIKAWIYRGRDLIGKPATVERRVPRGHIDHLPPSDNIGA